MIMVVADVLAPIKLPCWFFCDYGVTWTCSATFIWCYSHQTTLFRGSWEVNTPFVSLTELTHLPVVPHIYPSMNSASIGSCDGLSPVRRQAITWTNADLLSDLLSIGPLGIKFSEIRINIHSFSFMKMRLKCRLRDGGHFVQRGRVDELSCRWICYLVGIHFWNFLSWSFAHVHCTLGPWPALGVPR